MCIEDTTPMTSKQTININDSFVVEEFDRNESEMEVRRTAISDALRYLSDDITKSDGIGKVGYAGVAYGNDIQETIQSAINDIKHSSLQTLKHVFFYIEIDEKMKLGDLADLNNSIESIVPEGIAHSQYFQTVPTDQEKKVVAIGF